MDRRAAHALADVEVVKQLALVDERRECPDGEFHVLVHIVLMHAEAALEERLDLHPVELGQTLVEHRVALDLVGAGGDNGHAQQLAPIQGSMHLRPCALEECLQSGQVLAGLIVMQLQQDLHIEAHEGHAEL